MQLDGAKLALRPEEYYKVKFHLVVLDQCDVLKLVFTGWVNRLQKGDIEIIHEVSVNAVDAESKSILLSNEESLIYSHLVIATGGRYVKELKNFHIPLMQICSNHLLH